MRKIALVASVFALSASFAVAGPLGNVRERIKERRGSRHADHAEIVVGKDGKPLLRWSDGSTSKVGVDKDGKLIASPKTEGTKKLKQAHGPEINLVPNAKVN